MLDSIDHMTLKLLFKYLTIAMVNIFMNYQD